MADDDLRTTARHDGAGGCGFEVLDRTTCYRGYFRLDRLRVRFRLFAGGWSRPIEREVFERGHAACVLPYDAGRDRVVLVEQFRAPAIEAPGGAWLIETIAGIVEAGESPAEVVRREAIEEAGLEISALWRIGEILLSPGGSSERLALYCARADSAGAGGIHGLEDEGEDIRVLAMGLDEALAAVAEGRIRVANAVIPLQWLALNRRRVREAWRGTG
ncbi:MAG: NUDIX domain-containing protein [Alphaproteobacteria bacterium]